MNIPYLHNVFLFVVIMVLSGCASMRESVFNGHETYYSSGSHMKFSIWGHRNPSEETMKKSDEEGWWGIEVPYAPAE